MEAKLDGNRVKTVEAGLAYFQQVQQERDDLSRDLNKNLEIIVRLRTEVDVLHQHQAILESRVASSEAARDVAVAERAVYETLFASIKAMLNAFRIPENPLIDNMEERNEEITEERSQDRIPLPSPRD